MNAPLPSDAVALPRLPLAEIAPSPTNPRKHFDEKALADLAETIRSHGVIQPITVRPNPTGETIYELVVGERRWRASKLAGLEYIPAFWRDLSDKEVLEIQCIENLQRDDVHPLEEADGYHKLMKDHGYQAEQIADKIGKSKAYVYARLKLLALCEAAREPFYSGDLDASTALLIARIPQEALQKKALQQVITQTSRGYPMSFREAKWHIRNGFTLSLKQATFPLADADLLPEACACATCPKRSGNDPDLFGDIDDADVCSDTKCFEAKKLARREQIIAQAQEKKIPVVRGEEARKIMPHAHYADPSQYVRLDAQCPGDEEGRTYREILGDQAPVEMIVEHGNSETTKRLAELSTPTAMAEALKVAGWQPAEGKEGPEFLGQGRSQEEIEAEQAERERQCAERDRRAKIDGAWRHRLVDSVLEATRCTLGLDDVPALVALAIIGWFRIEMQYVNLEEEVLERWGHAFPEEGYDENEEAEKFISSMEGWGTHQYLAFFLDSLTHNERRHQQGWNLEDSDTTPALSLALAKHHSIDPEAIRQQVIAAIEAEEALAAESDPASAFPIGTRVRIKAGLKGHSHTRKCGGKEGTIESIDGVSIVVRTGPKRHEIIADLRAEDLERLDSAPAETASTPSEAALARDKGRAEAADEDTDPAPPKDEETHDPAPALPAEEPAPPVQEKPTRRNRPAVKYVHPDEENLTWAGKGRKPRWVEEWLDQGGQLADLEAKTTPAPAAPGNEPANADGANTEGGTAPVETQTSASAPAWPWPEKAEV